MFTLHSIHLIKGSSEYKVLINEDRQVFTSWSKAVWNKCAEEPWYLITLHLPDLETVPPKEVYYTSDNKRVHVA